MTTISPKSILASRCKPDFLWAFTHRNPRWSHAELHGNLTGWVQYRKTLAGECQ